MPEAGKGLSVPVVFNRVVFRTGYAVVRVRSFHQGKFYERAEAVDYGVEQRIFGEEHRLVAVLGVRYKGEANKVAVLFGRKLSDCAVHYGALTLEEVAVQLLSQRKRYGWHVGFSTGGRWLLEPLAEILSFRHRRNYFTPFEIQYMCRANSVK